MAIVHGFEFHGAKVFIHDDDYAGASEKELKECRRIMNQTAARLCREHLEREREEKA